ncbi:hypothetical protein HW115_00165 [Verrucomicrobiaceae bacterium N1E253]|uniref:Uncharacterized protein n=1 Tax=Oceaniferula marina TaxID=2748318 RepID=A0A851GFR2_9BACT|nr:hypothetical protein [Oceaniferula marina]NWK54007.1 hypothetical protein [Oceaniferula marina]
MNEREKKLVLILAAAGLLVVSLFGYTTYSGAMQKKKVELKKGSDELKLKKRELEQALQRIDEVEWLAQNMPTSGTHTKIRSELVSFVEQSCAKYKVNVKKRPSALRENLEEQGVFKSAVVKVMVNCTDKQMYDLFCLLQNPREARSITRMRIIPQRDDATKVDCELEITQWYSPEDEEFAEDAQITDN